MSQSLSLKRCNRYGTSSTTPKRPCLTTSQSTPAASITPEHCDKENETATAEDSLSTPHRSDLLTVNANSTPWNASSDVPVESSTAQSLEGLRCKRAELRQSVASKEQTLHNLNLVKLHRTKVCCLEYVLCLSGLYPLFDLSKKEWDGCFSPKGHLTEYVYYYHICTDGYCKPAGVGFLGRSSEPPARRSGGIVSSHSGVQELMGHFIAQEMCINNPRPKFLVTSEGSSVILNQWG